MWGFHERLALARACPIYYRVQPGPGSPDFREKTMSRTVRGGTGAFPQREIRRREENARKDRARTPFSHMTVSELRVWAQKLDVPNYTKLKKHDLVIAVRETFAREG